MPWMPHIERGIPASSGQSQFARPRRWVGCWWMAALPKERLEHQQRPEWPAVLATTRLMGVEQVIKVRRLEIARAAEFAFEQCRTHAGPQRASEPASHRHGK